MLTLLSAFLLSLLSCQAPLTARPTPTPVAEHTLMIPQQEKEPIQEISFSSVTRGGAENIRLTPDSVFIHKTGLMGPVDQKRAISKAEWQLVLGSLAQTTLKEIENLPAPTNQRQRDAAMHSHFSITTSRQTYTSSTFDNHEAPKPLQGLMKAVEQLSGPQK